MQGDNTVETLFMEENIWHGLTITDSAAQKICRLVGKDSTMLGVRLSIKQSGCAGFSYVVEKVMQPEQDDQIYEHEGAKLYVSLQAMPFIDGTEMDYVQQGLNHVFKFNNPKAQHACGCGESFGL